LGKAPADWFEALFAAAHAGQPVVNQRQARRIHAADSIPNGQSCHVSLFQSVKIGKDHATGRIA
jgi:hypothetical protein